MLVKPATSANKTVTDLRAPSRAASWSRLPTTAAAVGCRVVVLCVGGIAMAKRRSTAFTELGTRAVWSPARGTATRIITHALPARTTGHLRIIEVAFVPSIQTPLVPIASALTSRTSVRRNNRNRRTSVGTGATWQRSSSSHRTMACSPVCR
jgi:hypothetical protein